MPAGAGDITTLLLAVTHVAVTVCVLELHHALVNVTCIALEELVKYPASFVNADTLLGTVGILDITLWILSYTAFFVGACVVSQSHQLQYAESLIILLVTYQLGLEEL
jgi:hypothetical protein